VPPGIPRYDLVTELLVAALARRIGVDPDQFRAWTRGVEAPPEWFDKAIQSMLEPLVPEGHLRSLTSRGENSTIRTMRTEKVHEPRIGRPLKNTDHPLIAALAKEGITLAEEAKAVKRSPTAIRNYLYPAGEVSFRPIPRELAKLWHKKYGVPLTAWSRFQD
jgi:hypothetical protein